MVQVRADDLWDVLDRIERLPLVEQPHSAVLRRLHRAAGDGHVRGVANEATTPARIDVTLWPRTGDIRVHEHMETDGSDKPREWVT